MHTLLLRPAALLTAFVFFISTPAVILAQELDQPELDQPALLPSQKFHLLDGNADSVLLHSSHLHTDPHLFLQSTDTGEIFTKSIPQIESELIIPIKNPFSKVLRAASANVQSGNLSEITLSLPRTMQFLEQGQALVVARLSVISPDSSVDSIPLSSVLPVPSGVFSTTQSHSSLKIIDEQSGAVFTPSIIGGMKDPSGEWYESLELVVQVPNTMPGAERIFNVRYDSSIPGAVPIDTSLFTQFGQTILSVEPALSGLFTNPQTGLTGLIFEVRDVHNNTYQVNLDQSLREITKYSFDLGEARLFDTFQLVGQTGGTTMPHMGGLQVFAKAMRNTPCLSIVMHYSNSLANLNKTSSKDDAFDVPIYFQDLKLYHDSNAIVVPMYERPLHNLNQVIAGNSALRQSYIIRQDEPGRVHPLFEQRGLTERFAVCINGTEAYGRMLLDYKNHAFVIPAENPSQWSWHGDENFISAVTTPFTAMNMSAPRLESKDLNQMRDSIRGREEQVEEMFRTGIGTDIAGGLESISHNYLGAYMFVNGQYGGETNGHGMNIHGLGLWGLWARTSEYLKLRAAQQIATSNRIASKLLKEDGTPIVPEDILGTCPGGDSEYLRADFIPLYGGLNVSSGNTAIFNYGDGFANYPSQGGQDGETLDDDAQALEVITKGRQVSYYSDIASYDPIDLQHMYRYMRYSTFLARVTNDSYSKFELRELTAMARLNFPTHYRLKTWPSTECVAYSNSLRQQFEYVSNSPQRGVQMSRETMEALSAVAEAYPFLEGEERDNAKDYASFFIDTTRAAVIPCSGQIVKINNPGKCGMNYICSFQNQTQFLLETVSSLMETIFRGKGGADLDSYTKGREMIQSASQRLVFPEYRNDAGWPAQYIAIESYDGQILCPADLPSDGISSNSTGYPTDSARMIAVQALRYSEPTRLQDWINTIADFSGVADAQALESQLESQTKISNFQYPHNEDLATLYDHVRRARKEISSYD